jgi:hypothetical protein
MLKITREQLQAFERLSRQRFVEETIDHLYQFTPVHARSLRSERLRSIIELGIHRALKHGFTQCGPVRLFIEVMFTLGSDFDSDPQYPWVATLIGQEQAGELQLDRAHEFYLATNSYLDVAVGPEGKHLLEALRRAQSEGLDPAFDSFEELDGQIMKRLQEIGPEKSSYIDERGLRELIRYGRSMARIHGALTIADEVLIVLLMFGLGHGCLADPQFPWIAAILSRHESSYDLDKFSRLREVAMHYLGRTIRNLSRRNGFRSMSTRSGARP